jgi:hypothetical protein
MADESINKTPRDVQPPNDSTNQNETRTPPAETDVITAAPADDSEAPYSTFSISQKRWIIGMVSFASFFSPLSSTIYFPAISTIARDLNVTNAQVNLTVTTYLVRNYLSRQHNDTA